MFLCALITFSLVIIDIALFDVSFIAGLIGFIIAGGAVKAFTKTFFKNNRRR